MDTSFIHRDSEEAPCRAYSCPVELRDKALRELKETPEVQSESVTELRRAVTTECSSLRDEARTDDAFLIKFLRPKKYVVAKALNLFKNYHKLRETHAELFVDLHPDSVRHVWESGCMGCLSDRDMEGRNILLAFPQHWNPQEVTLRDALRSFILQLEYLTESEETQINGVALIVDFSKFTFEQLRALRPTYVQLLVSLVQNAFPARFKAAYILHQPWFFSVIMALFRPFLSEKMNNRIVLIGSDIHKLHELIPPENLPEELGGHLGPYDGKAWADTVTKWHRHSAMSSPTLSRGAESSAESFCGSVSGGISAKTDLTTDMNSLHSEVLEDCGPQGSLREGSESSEERFFDCEDEASWIRKGDNRKPLCRGGKWDAGCKSKSVPSLLHSQQHSPSLSERKTKSKRVTTV